MNYENPTPVTVNVVPVIDSRGDVIGFLGIERNIEPQAGGLAFPGGYVDKLESIEQAAAREFHEEVGITTSAQAWKLSHSAVTATNRVLVFCTHNWLHIAEAELETLPVTPEVRRFVVLNRESKLCFPLHQEALDAFMTRVPPPRTGSTCAGAYD